MEPMSILSIRPVDVKLWAEAGSYVVLLIFFLAAGLGALALAIRGLKASVQGKSKGKR